MCIVSNIGDGFYNDWKRRYPYWPEVYPKKERVDITEIMKTLSPNKDKRVDELEKEIKDIKTQLELLIKLLGIGKEYDEATGQKDCEVEEKVKLIKQLCELFNVDMKDVFEK